MNSIRNSFDLGKAASNEAVLIFKVGDFYELFYQDAELASKTLGLTLTTRNSRTENPTPMVGFPRHRLDAYLMKLVKNGNRVAVCESVDEDGTPIVKESQ